MTAIFKNAFKLGLKSLAGIPAPIEAYKLCKEMKYNNDLYEAAINHDIDRVADLLSKGACVDSMKDGYTALLGAAAIIKTVSESRRMEVIDYLIKKGADVKAKTPHGKTLLHIAATLGYIEVIKFLALDKFDINIEDSDGKTPLMEARNLEIVKYLVKKGADVNAKDNMGNTFLHELAICPNDHFEIVEFLVKKGAKINVRNEKGQTPLEIAKSWDNKLIAKILSKANSANA
ncbi:MAG: ankyrin repeat domain-containing protein [Fibromonadales bacterium]|nr:ankyrin repeat domain-containing protein [Fibromonadales bacterium]